MKRGIHPNSRPKHVGGAFSKAAPDGWEVRLRLALRLDNGCVLSARQCRELAAVLGWSEPSEPTEAA